MERPHCKHLVNGGSVGRRRQCKNRAQFGGDYCSLHANHPERRIEATRANLHDYVDAAIKALGRVVTEGEKDADVIKASIAILDRTGHGPSATVTVQDSDARLNAILDARRRAAGDGD